MRYELNNEEQTTTATNKADVWHGILFDITWVGVRMTLRAALAGLSTGVGVVGWVAGLADTAWLVGLGALKGL